MYLFIFINRLKYVFQGRNPILLLSIQSGVSLIEVFNDRNYSNTTLISGPGLVRLKEGVRLIGGPL